MANEAFFTMHITGEENDVYEVVKTLKTKFDYSIEKPKHKHLQRIFYVSEGKDLESFVKNNERYITKEISGSCAWSTSLCMLGDEESYYYEMKKRISPDMFMGTSLEILTKETDTVVEVYSEETMEGLFEHIIVNKGNLVLYQDIYEKELDLTLHKKFDTIDRFIDQLDNYDQLIVRDLLNEKKDGFIVPSCKIKRFDSWDYKNYLDEFIK